MEKLYKLKETLLEELEQFAKKGEVKAGELEAIHKLTDTIKNIDKICLLEEEGGYSQAGDWEMQGRGNSYAGRKRDAMGRYSREGGNGYTGGGYSGRGGETFRGRGNSYDDGRKEMMEHLYMMEESANNERDREMIRRFKEQLERG